MPLATQRDGSTATRVLHTLAEKTDTPSSDLPPLYEAIDPEALNALVESARREPATDLSLTFQFHGHRVVVTSDDDVTVAVDASSQV